MRRDQSSVPSHLTNEIPGDAELGTVPDGGSDIPVVYGRREYTLSAQVKQRGANEGEKVEIPTPKRIVGDLILPALLTPQITQTVGRATLQPFFRCFAPSGTAVVLTYCVLIRFRFLRIE